MIIVSGGQTGVDRGAMNAAIRLGFGYGGWAPAGFRSEDGCIPPIYAEHMRETSSADYGMRTRLNVQDSDATLIVSFASELTGGSRFTAEQCRAQRRPCKHLVLPQGRGQVPVELRDQLLEWIRVKHIATLNVAGPRESKEPGVQKATADTLCWILAEIAAEDLRQVIDTVRLLESAIDSDAPEPESSPAATDCDSAPPSEAQRGPVAAAVTLPIYTYEDW